MSTCPEKDIHSLYVDGELPASYRAQYEQHVASCPACRAKRDALMAQHDALLSDAASIMLSQEQVDRGFERLSARLSYSKTLTLAGRSGPAVRRYSPVVGALAGAAAAVAVMFALPARAGTFGPGADAGGQAVFTPVARTQIQSPSELVATSLSSSVLLKADSAEVTGGIARTAGYSLASPVMQVSSLGAGQLIFVDQTDGRDSMQALRASLANYDLFAPAVPSDGQKESRSGFSFTVSAQQDSAQTELGN